ncbi:SufD family Fe-S cluster assembly protein [Candidatus Woesearchaeota archaeon]|nr:SufD family Fe-S cluster assembly protein [Candidatus Woesearchaeota archaeon]
MSSSGFQEVLSKALSQDLDKKLLSRFFKDFHLSELSKVFAHSHSQALQVSKNIQELSQVNQALSVLKQHANSTRTMRFGFLLKEFLNLTSKTFFFNNEKSLKAKNLTIKNPENLNASIASFNFFFKTNTDLTLRINNAVTSFLFLTFINQSQSNVKIVVNNKKQLYLLINSLILSHELNMDVVTLQESMNSDIVLDLHVLQHSEKSNASVKTFSVNTGSKLLVRGLIHSSKQSLDAEADLQLHALTIPKNEGFKPEIVLMPRLEVLNKNVKARHSAITKTLTKQEMFYLQSRGLSTEQVFQAVKQELLGFTMQ